MYRVEFLFVLCQRENKFLNRQCDFYTKINNQCTELQRFGSEILFISHCQLVTIRRIVQWGDYIAD